MPIRQFNNNDRVIHRPSGLEGVCLSVNCYLFELTVILQNGEMIIESVKNFERLRDEPV